MSLFDTHTSKPCSTTNMAAFAIYEATAKKLEIESGKSSLASHLPFLAALRSSRSLVVGPLVGPSVGPSVGW